MQVSTDGIVRFIGRKKISTDDRQIYYQISLADEEGDTIKMFCDQAAYEGTKGLEFGDPMSLILSVSQYNKGISTRLKEVIVNG